MLTRIQLIGLALCGSLLLFAPAARAGSYEVRVCDSSGVNRAFHPVGSGQVVADPSCGADWALGMKVRNAVGAGTAPAFAWGALEAEAAPGTVISGLRGQGTAYGTQATGIAGGGWEAGISDASTFRWCGLPLGCLWAGPSTTPLAVGGLAADRVRLLVICSSGAGCPTGSVRAGATLRDAVIEVRDDSPPALDAMRGALASDGWQAGTLDASFSADDGSGIRRSRISLDGTPIADVQNTCDEHAMRPCPGGGAKASIDTRRLPDGVHRLTAATWDAAGNVSERTGELKVDNSIPGAARIEGPGSWVNSSSSMTVALRAPSTVGPSGVSGYAVTTDGSEPGVTPTAGGQEAGITVGPMSEGLHVIRARALGGTGVAAREEGRLELGVDRTAPEVSVELAPGSASGREDWVRGSASVSVAGTDQAGLSGMTAAPAGKPVEAGAYVEYQADSEPAVRVRGGSASFSFVRDGIHAVSVRAVDAAGNSSPPRTVSFRVDSKAPTGTLERPTREDPRRLRATVEEGCIASATLEMRPLVGGSWERIDGRSAAGSVSALVPDDRLPGGRYEARFRVVDCAGNEGVIAVFSDGSPGTVTLPMRMKPKLSASLVDRRGHEAGRLRVSMGSAVELAGRLLDADGQPMEGAEIEVRQRVGEGAWGVVARVQTSAAGRLAAKLPAGPSREIAVVALDTQTSAGDTVSGLRVDVPARVTIHVRRSRLHNGQAARFSGRVLGGHLPARGRELELQGFNPARGRWQPVMTEGLRCDRRGRWTARYRFSATTGGAITYRFRVRLAPRPDHPFAEGHSRSVAVRVSG